MKLSVVVCTYNGSKYLEEQLHSIIDQTRAVDEIIISDDKSSDDTVSVAEKVLSRSKIEYKISVNENNLGVEKNFLKGLSLSHGEYVFFSDQDDIWCKDKVEIFESEIKRSEKLLYFSDGYLIGANGERLKSTLWESLGFSPELIKDGFFKFLIRKSVITGAATAVSRKLIDEAQSIPEYYLHDEWFGLLAARKESIGCITEKTFLYRQHGNNVVGAEKRTIGNLVRRSLKQIKVLDTYREQKISKINSLIAVTEGEQKEYAKDALRFFSECYGLKNVNKKHGLKIIAKNRKNGSYSAYTSGRIAWIKDKLWVVFIKKAEKKNGTDKSN